MAKIKMEADEMWLRIHPRHDDLWAEITTQGPIRDNYPIFNKGLSIVSNASVVCQSTFYSVLGCVTWYDEIYRSMLSFAANNKAVLVSRADALMTCLDTCIAQTSRDAERFERELKELTAAQTIAEITLRQ